MTDVSDMADEAKALLDEAEAQSTLEGMDADTKVSILGAQFSTSEDLVLGQRVELRVVGYVSFAGDQLIENEGKRHIVKIQTNLIETKE